VAGVITITNAIGTLQVWTQAVSGHVAGDYVYTLTGKTTQGVNDAPSFNYVVTDSATSTTTNANLIINVVDDAPIGNDIVTTLTASASTATYNLVLVIDRSGSMAFDAAGLQVGQAGFNPATVRMAIAKDALAQLIDRFDGLGNVNVKIVDFSSNALQSTWYIDDKTNAVNYINNLEPAGGTNYLTALGAVTTGWAPPPADKTLFYFVTDGVPSDGGLTATSVPVSLAQWETFVTNSGTIASPSISFGIGIGTAALANLTPIAFPNVDVSPANGQEDYAITVNNAADLSATLLATVTGGVVIGNVSILSGGGSAGGFLMGADGGTIQSIVVDGVTYANNGATISILTNKGGQFVIDWASFSYTYQLTLNQTTLGQQEVFALNAVDGDGDILTKNLIINLNYTANLDANHDVILTNVGIGTPINISAEALMHNDAVSGTTATITSTQNGVAGTVSGTTNIVYTPTTATPARPITVESELFAAAVYDNATLPTNDIPIAAVDLTDRSRFGTVLPGAPAWTIDAAAGAATGGLTQVFSGRINAAADVDYVKVHLIAGETLYVDLDSNTANMTGSIQYYDAAGTLITPALNLTNVVGTGDSNSGPNGNYIATQDGDYYIRLTGATTNYNLVLTIGNIHGGINEFGQFDYTLTEGTASNNATADVFNVAGNIIAGGEGDEIIIGGATNDILRGNGGNDVLQGNAGTDNLSGGIGADRLEGGIGNDTLDGGTGNDILIGGANNDLLTGGAGSDTFVWKLADKGTVGTPANDTITDFSTAVGVDKLDLRDLLVGEVSAGPGANLENYLHFDTVAGGSTIVHISGAGAYSGGFNAANDVQTITLTGYDVSSFAGDQAAIIADLLTKQKLITD
jgi:hypothetical protein